MPRILSCLAVCLFCASAWAQPFLDSFDFHIISPVAPSYALGDTVELTCTAPYFRIMPRLLHNPQATITAQTPRAKEFFQGNPDGWVPSYLTGKDFGAIDTTMVASDTINISVILKYEIEVIWCPNQCYTFQAIRNTARLAIEVRYNIAIDTCTDMKDSIVCLPVCNPDSCWPQCDTLHIQHCARYNYETKVFYDTTDVFSVVARSSVMSGHLVRNQRATQSDRATYNILGRRVPGKAAQGIIIGTDSGRKYLTTNLW